MTKKEMIKLLKKDVGVWNKFRSENPDVEIDLRGIDLENIELWGADLRKVNLTDANLKGSDLSYSYLRYANLTNTDLRGTNLLGVDVFGANLVNAILEDTDLTNIKKLSRPYRMQVKPDSCGVQNDKRRNG